MQNKKFEGKIVLLGMHRSGTVFIEELVDEITVRCRIPAYSTYQKNLPDSKESIYQLISSRSGCFGIFRVRDCTFLLDLLDRFGSEQVFNSWRIVINLRDPRDMLTSHYFSAAYSHFGIDGNRRNEMLEKGIDWYLKNHEIPKQFLNTYLSYVRYFIGKPGVISLKYEEMVTDFGTWLWKLLQAFPLSEKKRLKLREKLYLKSLKEKWFTVDQEDIYTHRRKVAPGDYRKKLKPETIAYLNSEFKEVLIALNYEI